MPSQNEGAIYLNKEDNEMCNCIANYNTSRTKQLQHAGNTKGGCGYVAVVRVAGGEVVTRLAEVESGVTGGCWHTLGHWDMLHGVHRSQSSVWSLVLHSDTISSGDNDGDGLQRRTA